MRPRDYPNHEELDRALQAGEIEGIEAGTTLAEVHEQARRNLQWAIAMILERPIESIKVELFDPGLAGRTGMDLQADPPLTQEESDKVQRLLEVWSAAMDCRPPIKGGQA